MVTKPKMSTSFSVTFLFIVLAFAVYANALHSNDHHDTYQQLAEPHGPVCGKTRKLLIIEEPSPPKKEKPSGHTPWWKWRPKWNRKKSPPKPPPRLGHGWPPVWPPLTPFRALRTRLQEEPPLLS